jgi:hypothetical protein
MKKKPQWIIKRKIIIIETMTSKQEKSDNIAFDKPKHFAPDGGFGWFIVIAYGTANVSRMCTEITEGH